MWHISKDKCRLHRNRFLFLAARILLIILQLWFFFPFTSILKAIIIIFAAAAAAVRRPSLPHYQSFPFKLPSSSDASKDVEEAELFPSLSPSERPLAGEAMALSRRELCISERNLLLAASIKEKVIKQNDWNVNITFTFNNLKVIMVWCVLWGEECLQSFRRHAVC